MAIVRSLTWIKKGKSSRIVEAAHILEREIVDAFFLPTYAYRLLTKLAAVRSVISDRD